jgi:hypothetical protein
VAQWTNSAYRTVQQTLFTSCVQTLVRVAEQQQQLIVECVNGTAAMGVILRTDSVGMTASVQATLPLHFSSLNCPSSGWPCS